MTSATSPHNEWTALGEKLAPTLDGVHATVIAGPDPVAAAHVALAIARLQGANRRVAIADLVGELPPLQSLVGDDGDPHGVSDSFLYGVSLNKIARPIDAVGSVFLMPSGTESVANESVYANDRWRRLAAGFHQVGALLLIVAAPDTPGFTELCGYVGALLPVGDYRFALPRGVPLVAPVQTASPSSQDVPAVGDGSEGADTRGRARRAREAAAQDNASRQRKLVGLVAIVFALAIAIGTAWPRIVTMLPAPLARMFGEMPADTTSGPAIRVEAPIDSARADSAAANDTMATGAGEPATSAIAVANPQDSLRAARFSIYYTSANTREAAMPDDRIRALPSVAMTPVPDGNEQWYRLTIGAYNDRAEAAALLRRMQDEGLIGSGSIVRVPYALRLEDSVALGAATARVTAYARRGIFAYALRQGDGRVTIYTGAFETPRQAAMLADSLRNTGVEPVLVLRTGRAF